MRAHRREGSNGFSLVELSIVLVILGLLVGGVLSGQSLIRASQLRAVSSEYQRYITAARTFRDKYFATPGDMVNATSFWGDNNAICPDGAITNGTPGTCNGNGNGVIEFAVAADDTGEVFQFWLQLAYAGLIEGSYTGINGPTNANNTLLGTNVPRSKLSNAGWSAGYYAGIYAGAAPQNFAGEYGNHFVFGADTASVNDDPILKPEDAWNIDTKIDDGKPATGNVIAKWYSICTNATGVSDTASTYTLTSSAVGCGFFFVRAF